MFKEPAVEAGDRSTDVTPELADQLCVLLGGKPSANAGRRAGLAKPAEAPGTLTTPIPPASPLPDASPIPPATPIPDIPDTMPRSQDSNGRVTTPVATGGLKMRNRHTPRLCVACEAPLGSQDNACWRCGSRWADRHEQRAEPDQQARSDADRCTDEGGGLAGNVVFQVDDGRGAEMLAELEERTSHRSTVTPSGEREYELSAAEVGVGGFDPILDLIDTGWRDHLSRTPLPTT
jgi:hypothetical protein